MNRQCCVEWGKLTNINLYTLHRSTHRKKSVPGFIHFFILFSSYIDGKICAIGTKKKEK